jgi:hypothetical protein
VTERQLEASCLCGSVRYTLNGPIDEIALCYCDQCKRANGGAFNVAVIVARNQVSFQSRKTISEFESSPGKFRAFCRTCASPIYSRRDDLPQTLRLRGGLIADLPGAETISQGYNENRWSWLTSDALGLGN